MVATSRTLQNIPCLRSRAASKAALLLLLAATAACVSGSPAAGQQQQQQQQQVGSSTRAATIPSRTEVEPSQQLLTQQRPAHTQGLQQDIWRAHVEDNKRQHNSSTKTILETNVRPDSRILRAELVSPAATPW
jgi:hemolysin activation/secretion protein